MNIQELLLSVKSFVDLDLADFFQKKTRFALSVHSYAGELADQVKDLTLRGGKRTRPLFCLLGYHSYGKTGSMDSVQEFMKKTPQFVRQAMTAIELFHSFALIHDDIMDEDPTRRGKPAVHEYFKSQKLRVKNKKIVSLENARHFGESQAILAGDLALVWADELMQKSSLERGRLSRLDSVMPLYQKMKEEIAYGQSIDVAGAAGVVDVDRLRINEMKTAWYSVIRPLQIGAALSGASTTQIERLVAYGLPVGLAFQLKDDAMDGEITHEDLVRKGRVLVEKAKKAVEILDIRPSLQPLFCELATFVISRSS